MDQSVKDLFAARDSGDKESSYEALVKLFALAEQPVDWAYEVWGTLVDDLSHADMHKRSFSAQMLSRLSQSDPEGRMLKDFPAVAAVMQDESFVVARHTMQSIWRVGLGGPAQVALVLAALSARFRGGEGEKNASLVRTDVIKSLRFLADAVGDAGEIEKHAGALMDAEPDEKARKKQRAAWKNPGR
ncbi:hypothetical protein [Chondromyces crocatus]|uniref:PBS lyase n=1 Tax=Chondromyces crocatus TaxID=52 RepID=A0A0K1ERS9_CHOCO|nr:hypothetical protein [Chondromyces crocatus]AKT43551.1 uncharacterized protein CMC5_077830 [Chondromyces crocatus]